MQSPVFARIEVVRGVVAIIEAEPVRLQVMRSGCNVKRSTDAKMNSSAERELTATSMTVMEDLKSLAGSVSSTNACWPVHRDVKAKAGVKAESCRSSLSRSWKHHSPQLPIIRPILSITKGRSRQNVAARALQDIPSRIRA